MRWWERRSEPAATCGEIAEAPLATPPARRRGVRSRGVDVMTRRGAIRIRKPVARDIESASADPGTCRAVRARGGPSTNQHAGTSADEIVADERRAGCRRGGDNDPTTQRKRCRLYTSSDRPSSDSSHEGSGIHEAPGSLKRRHGPRGSACFPSMLSRFPACFPSVTRVASTRRRARGECARADTRSDSWRTDTAL